MRTHDASLVIPGSRAWLRRATWVMAALAFAASLSACPGEEPPDGPCSSSGDCQGGLQCLYPLGRGCSGKGQCDVPTTDCGGSAVGLVLCGCGEAVDFSCVPATATLPVRTATGPACLADGGDAGDAGDADDAGG